MISRLIACLAVVVPALFAPAIAQDVRVPSSAGEIRLSYAPVVKRVAPAVVNVYSKSVVQAQANPFFNDPLFSQLFGTPEMRQRVAIKARIGYNVAHIRRPDFDRGREDR